MRENKKKIRAFRSSERGRGEGERQIGLGFSGAARWEEERENVIGAGQEFLGFI